MTNHPSEFPTQAAVQHLIWALEEIEKAGNERAALHARSALKALQEPAGRPTTAQDVGLRLRSVAGSAKSTQ
jgi:hypothetical protein